MSIEAHVNRQRILGRQTPPPIPYEATQEDIHARLANFVGDVLLSPQITKAKTSEQGTDLPTIVGTTPIPIENIPPASIGPAPTVKSYTLEIPHKKPNREAFSVRKVIEEWNNHLGRFIASHTGELPQTTFTIAGRQIKVEDPRSIEERTIDALGRVIAKEINEAHRRS